MVKAHYKQSTFYGAALSPKQLRKQADNFVPKRNEIGEIDQFILSQMDGAITQGEIALSVCQRWPQQFDTTKAALTHIAALSAKYCD